ncbi:MAG: 16S rRNA (cytosine(967)-C(5))-methyltransferase RsmB [Lachnospiraceae bacterium]|nr:16S rRNA (cytosine(967)-C(5))-methyltransferase RsmB [Lachnospiraceae bacterium]
MSVNVREIIAKALYELETGDTLSHYLIRDILEKYDYLDDRDKAFIKRVTEGTLARKLTLDYVLNGISDKPVSKCKPIIRVILRMSAYQLMYLDKVPASAVCDEAVKLCEKLSRREFCPFVNAVLRKLSAKGEEAFDLSGVEDRLTRLSITYSVPLWIVNMLEKEQGDTETLLKGLTESRGISVRIIDKAKESQLVKSWTEAGLNFTESKYVKGAYTFDFVGSPDRIPGFKEGFFIIQDESSMLAALATGVKEGDDLTVLDMCAAPGGKTSFIAGLMNPKGHVLSFDVSKMKTSMINENIERLGLTNVTVSVNDASVLNESLVEKGDVVLIDAPCSGLGVIGRKSDLRYNISNEGMRDICALQKVIVSTAANYVKPGGILVYSTCTIHKAENEKVVKYITDNLPFGGDSLRPVIPELFEGNIERASDYALQLRPDRDGTDGFFIARFKKKA